YCLVHLGCQMNQSDAERIRAVIEDLGYERTEDEEQANLLGIVACSVRQKAIDKVYSKIEKWNQWKNHRNLLTFVSGCILPVDREKFLTRFDLLFQIEELPDLPGMIRQNGIVTQASLQQHEPPRQPASVRSESASPGAAGKLPVSPDPAVAQIVSIAALKPGAVRTDASPAQVVPVASLKERRSGYWKISPHYSSSFEAFVPIQNGCDKFCTFCAVPYTRGREVSRSSAEILSEVEYLVSAGYRSITLLGQNVNSYGLDRGGSELSFAGLLEAIGKLGDRVSADGPARFWLYFTSPHPRDMTLEVLETIAQYRCLAKQIHLPIQSGDDKVLIRMNRNYRLDHYRSVVHNIRRILPSATLFTDIIVGFTGETDEQFEATRRAMQEFRYNMAYIAMYSPRPGAASSRWDDDVPLEQKKQRLHELSEELQSVSLDHNTGMIGSTCTVLVTGEDRKSGYLSAKTEGLLTVRFASGDSKLIGSFVEVRITSCAALSLTGEFVQVAEPQLAEAL
ncbi:MAG TPA: MiaB/RimO family radical SAM methylthiotransferase, partial [Spirochaetia bacterium]|nr:MiaB/RimO family radical SAM methylthiotransferase [Spirochaetia bacterium]